MWCRSDARLWHFFLKPFMWCRSDARLWHFFLKPFMWCRSDARLWHFFLKPFMWCRSDARLWHYYSAFFRSRSLSDTRLARALLFCIFPLEESFRHSFGTSIIILHFSARGVFQTLVWHQYYYSTFFHSRSLSDTRLAPSIYYLY